MAGRPANDGNDIYAVMRDALEAKIAPLRSLRPDLPPTFDAAVMRALERDPGARFSSVFSFGRALLPFASDKGRGRWTTVFDG